MPDTYDDQSEQNNGTVLAKDVQQDLQDWLSRCRCECRVVVLDGKEEA